MLIFIGIVRILFTLPLTFVLVVFGDSRFGQIMGSGYNPVAATLFVAACAILAWFVTGIPIYIRHHRNRTASLELALR